MEIKVSIITPVYNSAQFLIDTYLSLKNQEYQFWEWICVDDCSDDDSKNILSNLAAKDVRIELKFLKKNKGAAFARNTAIDMANGRFIAFLDSDDLWEPHKLSFQISKMIDEKISISHTSYGFIDFYGKTIASPYLISGKNISYDDLLKYNEMGCSTVIYDQSILGKVYMENIRIRQDYTLWLKILRRGHNSQGFKEVLTKYRIWNGSICRNKFIVVKYQWIVLRDFEKQSWLKSIYYLSCWAKHGFIKYYLNFF